MGVLQLDVDADLIEVLDDDVIEVLDEDLAELPQPTKIKDPAKHATAPRSQRLSNTL
jgi:hypothetical protein